MTATNLTTGRRVGTRPEDEKYPIARSVGYGLQHVLSMFGGVIAVPLIIGGAAGLSPAQQALLVACALFISGASTLLQTLGVPYFGSQLPLVQGISFASVSTMITIIVNHGGGPKSLGVVYGAIIVAGVVGLIVAPFFSSIVRFFPPVVTGSIITVIGLSLLPTAAGWITGQPTITEAGKTVANPEYATAGNVGLGMLTLAIVLVLSKIPILSRFSVLLGLAIGTIIALFTGQTNFSAVGQSAVFAFPKPFAFGLPTFDFGAIVSMVIVALVIMVETTADLLAVSEIVGTRIDSRRVADGLRADMLSSVVAPVFNSFPTTAFAQNVGLVAISGVKSRFVVASGGAILVILGLFPVAASVVNVIPQPVLGGAGFVLFGTVAASGIRTLLKADFRDTNNLVIVAVSISMGAIPIVASGFWTHFPSWFVTIFSSGISAASISAVALNLFFNVFRPSAPPQPSGLAAAPPLQVSDEEIEVLSHGGGFNKGQPDTAAIRIINERDQSHDDASK
ncbi:nucleobase:cation symporter-2 family protein [Gryllotalpicola protaetiae]|uniref:Purine permease n=1 Tax=Gryllotalpicola protaetiae TaxID=2419771 RepID=A0A387BIC9_9MICO|nr:nucleobase:cation symporter-2 family protein [Gryllotalpicola protaetiae]AYG02448.1 purine permease [Gryllotalpicola protaetiae]